VDITENRGSHSIDIGFKCSQVCDADIRNWAITAMESIKRPPVYLIPIVQCAVLLPASMAAWWIDPSVACSILLGGLLHLLPNTYFALYAFRYQGARSAPLALRAMSRGEVGKFVLTMVGFAMVFSLYPDVNVIALFIAYLVMIVVAVVITSRLVSPRDN